VDNFPHLIGQIERLLFSRPDWDAVQGLASMRQIQAARGPVTVSSFPSDDTHLMVVMMSSGYRLRLLVVPSDANPDLALKAMQQAADDRNEHSPKTLLGLSGWDQSEAALGAWDDSAGNPTWGSAAADADTSPPTAHSAAEHPTNRLGTLTPPVPSPAAPVPAPVPAPAWAVEQAASELYDIEDQTTIDARAWEIVRENAQLEAERHDEYDDPDQGGEG